MKAIHSFEPDMRTALLLLALVSAGCGARAPVATPSTSPSSAALAARELVFAADTRLPAIKAAVAAGTVSKAEATRQVTVIRDLLVDVEQLNTELSVWSQAKEPAKRAALKAAVAERVKAMGARFALTPDWVPLLDAYARTVLAVGGAQ